MENEDCQNIIPIAIQEVRTQQGEHSQPEEEEFCEEVDSPVKETVGTIPNLEVKNHEGGNPRCEEVPDAGEDECDHTVNMGASYISPSLKVITPNNTYNGNAVESSTRNGIEGDFLELFSSAWARDIENVPQPFEETQITPPQRRRGRPKKVLIEPVETPCGSPNTL